MFKNTISKMMLGVMLITGLTIGGCDLYNNPIQNEVGITIAHVQQFAQTAEALSAVATVTYLKENAVAVKVVLDEVIKVVSSADGNISALILSTVDEAVNNGQLNSNYKIFFIGVMAVVNDYAQFNDFNIDDVLVILRAASNGLAVQAAGGVEAQEAPGFNW